MVVFVTCNACGMISAKRLPELWCVFSLLSESLLLPLKFCGWGRNVGVHVLFVFAISFQVECEQVSFAAVHGSLEHAPNYILHIYPPAILHNYLPYNIRYASQVSTINSSFWNF